MGSYAFPTYSCSISHKQIPPRDKLSHTVGTMVAKFCFFMAEIPNFMDDNEMKFFMDKAISQNMFSSQATSGLSYGQAAYVKHEGQWTLKVLELIVLLCETVKSRVSMVLDCVQSIPPHFEYGKNCDG